MRHIVSETDSHSQIQTDSLNNLKVRKMRDKNVSIQTKRQTDRQRYIQTKKLTNKEADRQ